jgi:hypothetical protein
MGRKSRAKQERKLRQSKESSPAHPLRITIATAPRSGATGMSLAKDVELVKAGLLYADEIELMSLAAAGLSRVLELAILDREGVLRLIEHVDSERKDGSSSLTAFNAINKIAEVDPVQLRKYTGYEMDPELQRKARELSGNTDRILRETRELVDKTLTETGAGELEPAYRAGILKLSDSGLSDGHRIVDAIPDFLAILVQTLEDPNSHLLFDDRVAFIVRTMVGEKIFEPHPIALSHAGQAALGSGFVARLPTFPSAPIDELLDLRSDLTQQLSRYRRGVTMMANGLKSRAYDDGLDAELDDLWRTNVRPALDEIEDAFSEHSLIREIARQASTDVKTLLSGFGTGAIFIGIESLTNLGSLVAIVGALSGPGTALAQQVAKAHFRQRDELRAHKKHDLFYLYDLDRRILARS